MSRKRQRPNDNGCDEEHSHSHSLSTTRTEQSSGSRPQLSPEHGYPLRDISSLYAMTETIDCALQQNCIPCAYKICGFDAALDTDFSKVVPNQRPEQCPRATATSSQSAATNTTAQKTVYGFQPGMSVLTVGDGDFTFSLAIARLLLGSKMAPAYKKKADEDASAVGKVVATSYESIETLRQVYPNFDEILQEMKELGVVVGFQVDATRLDETLPKTVTGNMKFHRICWNFPCSAIARGQDGQNQEMEHNKQLIRNFISNGIPYLTKRDGEFVLCHKTKPPYNQWNLEQVVLEGSCHSNSSDDDKPRLDYIGRIALDRFLLPPYTPRKALDRKSFPCHDACFFYFAQTRRKNKSKYFPPTIPNSKPGAGDNANAKVQQVNAELIHSIRSHLLSIRKGKSAKRFDHVKSKMLRSR